MKKTAERAAACILTDIIHIRMRYLGPMQGAECSTAYSYTELLILGALCSLLSSYTGLEFCSTGYSAKDNWQKCVAYRPLTIMAAAQDGIWRIYDLWLHYHPRSHMACSCGIKFP